MERYGECPLDEIVSGPSRSLGDGYGAHGWAEQEAIAIAMQEEGYGVQMTYNSHGAVRFIVTRHPTANEWERRPGYITAREAQRQEEQLAKAIEWAQRNGRYRPRYVKLKSNAFGLVNG